jgi:hypothetical protein
VVARVEPGSIVEIEQAELIESWDPHRVQKTVSRRHSSMRSGHERRRTFGRAIPGRG